ncbi:MAG: amino acid permease [Pseudomonadota bacterium]
MNRPESTEKSYGVSVYAAAAVAIGMVIGAGLFKSPALVAANAGGTGAFFGAWILGGILSIIGALCYAELASTYPSRGGDYQFLSRAYGRPLGFLFAWARFAVINTGSIALLGYVLGDYLNSFINLGPYGSALYATAVVIALTLLNLRSRSAGIGAQSGLTLVLILAVLSLGVLGLVLVLQGQAPLDARPLGSSTLTGFGSAMVFVMLAFGGWTEIATLSTEVRDRRHGMLKALVLSMTAVTLLYLIINWALWRGLGLSGLADSAAPAADLVAAALGEWARIAIILVVSVAVITSINATILVGARTTFAAAADWPKLDFLGQWESERGSPQAAIAAQGMVAIALIGLGAITREGFATLVDFTAPVYWLFIVLSGIAVIRLRQRDPQRERPYQVPLYPWVPLAFIIAGLFVLWSSINYVRIGGLVGLGILAVGVVLMWWIREPEASA